MQGVDWISRYGGWGCYVVVVVVVTVVVIVNVVDIVVVVVVVVSNRSPFCHSICANDRIDDT